MLLSVGEDMNGNMVIEHFQPRLKIRNQNRRPAPNNTVTRFSSPSQESSDRYFSLGNRNRYKPGPGHINQHVSNWTNSRITRQRSPTPVPEPYTSSNPSSTLIPSAIQQLDNFIMSNHSSVKRSSVKRGAWALDKQVNSVPAPQRKVLYNYRYL